MKPERINLTPEVGKFARRKGADLFGVADLGPARDFIAAQSNATGEFPRAVSLGMRLCDAIVDGHSPDEPRRSSLYWHHVYDVVSAALNFTAYDVARWLADRGYRVLPVPASTPYHFEKLAGLFSHKLAAHLAGLGWIGKSCLLLTDAFGPRVRLATVLTDAPLETGSPLDKRCAQCQVCADTCPVSAFTGREFDPAEGREARFDIYRCSAYRKEHPCGLCVSSCPRGRNRKRPGKKES